MFTIAGVFSELLQQELLWSFSGLDLSEELEASLGLCWWQLHEFLLLGSGQAVEFGEYSIIGDREIMQEISAKLSGRLSEYGIDDGCEPIDFNAASFNSSQCGSELLFPVMVMNTIDQQLLHEFHFLCNDFISLRLFALFCELSEHPEDQAE